MEGLVNLVLGEGAAVRGKDCQFLEIQVPCEVVLTIRSRPYTSIG